MKAGEGGRREKGDRREKKGDADWRRRKMTEEGEGGRKETGDKRKGDEGWRRREKGESERK
jgi:hypothetical protein